MPNIIFIHPDLGIGGAERLIVDAALALQSKGHDVHILTSHHDKNHCFEETRDGTIPVTVYGDWLPKSVFGSCSAVCAYIRMIFVALSLLLSRQFSPDVIICDLVSVAIPVLKLKCNNILFYCHFPDQLLSKPGGVLKEYYRSVLNWMEEFTTRQASKIFVNSKFTASVFAETFISIKNAPIVLYPSLPTSKFDSANTVTISEIIGGILPEGSVVFLSLNRYERKKNVELALKAFMEMKSKLNPIEWDRCHLIIAGGYDKENSENIEYFCELEDMIVSNNLQDKITMLKSPSEKSKISLLKNCLGLIYTPSNEHFGIVPLESMYLMTPVIAVNSGGPRETIVDGKTGFLRDSIPQEFAKVMVKLVQQKDLAAKLGAAGRDRVKTLFSFERFASQLDLNVRELLNE